jgi:glyoxylase-like metal-dependent hydrolase (beta-lactamase superfamily II)
MNDVEQVTEDLYIVRQDMRPGWYLSVLVFFGKKSIGIVDTGYENTPEDHVLPLIKEKGREPDEVTLIVNTHRDGDHVRGNTTLKEKTGAQIAVHSLEAEAVPSADLLIEDGDTLALGDRDFKVIHTPGHRPGAICLMDESHGLLVTGDSVCGEREDLIRMDKAVYVESLRRLRDAKANTMIMSHPFMPAGKNILHGHEIAEMIEASIRVAEPP